MSDKIDNGWTIEFIRMQKQRNNLLAALQTAETDLVQAREMNATGCAWSDNAGSALASIRVAISKALQG